LKVGFVQFQPRFGLKETNIERSVQLIRATREVDLLVLPELCNTGYLFSSREEARVLAEHVPEGPTTEAWLRAAAETGATVVAGLCEEERGNLYISAVVVAPTGYIGTYRKSHLFSREKLIFTPGDTGFKVFELRVARIGVMICYDWLFPEAARALALKGAQIICHPANLVLPYAQKAMLTRSVENRVFTITANRVGSETGGLDGRTTLTFTGMSQVTSPEMTVLVRASAEKEEVRVVEIDPSQADNKYVAELSHVLDDRRPSLYAQLMEGAQSQDR